MVLAELDDDMVETLLRDRSVTLRVKFGVHGMRHLHRINPIIADGKARSSPMRTGRRWPFISNDPSDEFKITGPQCGRPSRGPIVPWVGSSGRIDDGVGVGLVTVTETVQF